MLINRYESFDLFINLPLLKLLHNKLHIIQNMRDPQSILLLFKMTL